MTVLLLLLLYAVPGAAQLAVAINGVGPQSSSVSVQGVLAAFSQSFAGMTASGVLMTAAPPDGCGAHGVLYGAVLLVSMQATSNCTAFSVGVRAGAAGAVAVIVALTGDATVLVASPAEERLPSPPIPVVSIAAASAGQLLALSRPASIQLRIATADGMSLSYIMMLTLLMIALAAASVLLLCVWYAFVVCRTRRQHARNMRARAAIERARGGAGNAESEALSAALAALVARPYTPAVGEVASASEICAVCQAAYQQGDGVCTLPCGHDFHHACVLPWLRQRGTCPLCKAGIAPRPAAGPAEESDV